MFHKFNFSPYKNWFFFKKKQEWCKAWQFSLFSSTFYIAFANSCSESDNILFLIYLRRWGRKTKFGREEEWLWWRGLIWEEGFASPPQPVNALMEWNNLFPEAIVLSMEKDGSLHYCTKLFGAFCVEVLSCKERSGLCICSGRKKQRSAFPCVSLLSGDFEDVSISVKVHVISEWDSIKKTFYRCMWRYCHSCTCLFPFLYLT